MTAYDAAMQDASVGVRTVMQFGADKAKSLIKDTKKLQQIIDLAKNYEHFAELRVSSAKDEARACWEWKEDFHLTPQCIKDHDALKYVERLFNSAHPLRDTCQIYAEDGSLM